MSSSVTAINNSSDAYDFGKSTSNSCASQSLDVFSLDMIVARRTPPIEEMSFDVHEENASTPKPTCGNNLPVMVVGGSDLDCDSQATSFFDLDNVGQLETPSHNDECKCLERKELHYRNCVGFTLGSEIKLSEDVEEKLAASRKKKMVDTPTQGKRRMLSPPYLVSKSHQLEQMYNEIDLKCYHDSEDLQIIRRSRDRISEIETLLNCEFLLSKEVKVKISLLRDHEIELNNRILITLSAGNNQIVFPASVFLDIYVHTIDEAIYRADIVEYEGKWQVLDLDGDFNVEAIKEHSAGIYLVLRRMFDNKHVMERVFIAGKSWGELKKLQPMLKSIYETYYVYCISRRATNIQRTDLVYSPILSRRENL